MRHIQEKVIALRSFEQILADKKGYHVETYGKWHAPYKFFYSKINRSKRIVVNNQVRMSAGYFTEHQAPS